MNPRTLSPLQQAYKEFFLGMLEAYGVGSPAQLSKELKSEFFTRIKLEWKARKEEIQRVHYKPKPQSKKSQYARVNISKPSVALEPRASYQKTSQKSERRAAQIISEKNPAQKPDLRINYHPHDFFEQIEPYVYPVVKMPKANSLLKLPRQGRAQGRGYKERDFYRAISYGIPHIEMDINAHLTIPHFNKPYEPDIVLFDKKLNLYIDIEIDEPYDGYYRYPTHELEKDDTRDLFFNESGWVVIRFTERQVHEQESECIAFIKDVLEMLNKDRFEPSSNVVQEEQWNYQKALGWQKENYRENYLGIDRFGKNTSQVEVIIDINEEDEIETNLQRTKKFHTKTSQDNIAFEDETHKYHHPKDSTGNAEYISVTTLIDRFFPFDLDRFIAGKAEKENRTPEEVLEEFIKNRDEAAEKGTYLHEQIEKFLKGQAHERISKEFQMFLKFYEDVVVANGFEFVEAEKKILLEEYNIAGTVDALFRKPNTQEYIIIDWKRSKKLVIDCHPRKFGYGYALSELAHLDNSSYFKYELQQNMYKYILEREYETPISSMNLIVLHENYDKYCRVSLDDRKREVKIILNSLNHKI